MHYRHSGISEESILMTVGQPASCDAGIRVKPLGGRPPNPLSLVLTGEATEWLPCCRKAKPFGQLSQILTLKFHY